MLSESLDDAAAPRQDGRKMRELLPPLGVHALFGIAYTAIFMALVGLLVFSSFTITSSSASFDAELLALLWLGLVVAPIWLIFAALLTWWWRQGRQGLVKRTLAWDALLWLGLWVAFLLAWKRTRAFLVPAKPEMISDSGRTS
jgi:hypothetical protein